MPASIRALPRGPRQDNRRAQLLDAAARLFSERGFHATSMRDIAKAVGMLSGSIYYHFESKDEILLAIFDEGTRRVDEAVAAAVALETEPWARLEAACAAHLRGLVAYPDYTRVLLQATPDEANGAGERIRELRRGYEARFRELIHQLPLPANTDRRYLRLLLFGALNYSPVWFHPGGDPPETVAQRFVDMLRTPLG
jgi:TetR/AcrR family transcriptional regulator, cholesterol catabolism regulator